MDKSLERLNEMEAFIRWEKFQYSQFIFEIFLKKLLDYLFPYVYKISSFRLLFLFFFFLSKKMLFQIQMSWVSYATNFTASALNQKEKSINMLFSQKLD